MKPILVAFFVTLFSCLPNPQSESATRDIRSDAMGTALSLYGYSPEVEEFLATMQDIYANMQMVRIGQIRAKLGAVKGNNVGQAKDVTLPDLMGLGEDAAGAAEQLTQLHTLMVHALEHASNPLSSQADLAFVQCDASPFLPATYDKNDCSAFLLNAQPQTVKIDFEVVDIQPGPLKSSFFKETRFFQDIKVYPNGSTRAARFRFNPLYGLPPQAVLLFQANHESSEIKYPLLMPIASLNHEQQMIAEKHFLGKAFAIPGFEWGGFSHGGEPPKNVAQVTRYWRQLNNIRVGVGTSVNVAMVLLPLVGEGAALTGFGLKNVAKFSARKIPTLLKWAARPALTRVLLKKIGNNVATQLLNKALVASGTLALGNLLVSPLISLEDVPNEKLREILLQVNNVGLAVVTMDFLFDFGPMVWATISQNLKGVNSLVRAKFGPVAGFSASTLAPSVGMAWMLSKIKYETDLNNELAASLSQKDFVSIYNTLSAEKKSRVNEIRNRYFSDAIVKINQDQIAGMMKHNNQKKQFLKSLNETNAELKVAVNKAKYEIVKEMKN